jgi:hypothetical protein
MRELGLTLRTAQLASRRIAAAALVHILSTSDRFVPEHFAMRRARESFRA